MNWLNVAAGLRNSNRVSAVQRVSRWLGVALIVVLFSSASLFAQGNSGRILGTVSDQSGGAISGATITVTDVARGASRMLTTDASGAYNAPDLTPSTYTVRAEFKGFKAFERQNVVLEVGQDVRVDATLQPGEQTQTVTVTEAIPLVNTTTAELGGTLQNQVMEDLPLNGRNFQNLLSLRPGISQYKGGAGWTNTANGVRPHDNMYLVNGVDANDPWMAQSMMNAVMAAGDAGTMLPIDAIDEFKTVFNPPAQYGWKPGGVINIGLKSGTNSIHGTAYAYGRDGDWDARDYFNQLPAVQPPVEVEQFGASVGGPIKKDKIFYFGNFESQRYNVGNPAVHEMPITNPAISNSNSLVGACKAASAANKLTALSAQLAGLNASCAPLSNFPGLFIPNSGADGTTVQTALVSTSTIWAGVGKVDYHVNANNTINASYFISPGTGNFVDNAITEVGSQWITAQYARSQSFSANWTWTPSSNWVNEFRIGYSHYYQTFLTPDATDNPANYTYNGSTYHFYSGQTNPQYFGLPDILFSSYPSYELGGAWPKYVGPDGVLDIDDHISYTHGNHSFMFGGEILDNTSTNNVTQYVKGNFRFANLTNFFEGTPNRSRYTTGNLLRHLSSQGYALFLQDDWRVRPRLSVNLGVRYELNTVVKERDNLIGNFDPTLGPTQVGSGGFTSPYNGDHKNFGPRVGIAYDLFGNGKTVARVGGSLIYEQMSFDNTQAVGNLLGLRTEPTGVPLYYNGLQGVTQGGTINVGATQLGGGATNEASIIAGWKNNSPSNVLFASTPVCGDANTTIASGPLAGVTPNPCTVLGVDRDLRTPYVASWMADLQQAVTNNLSLDVAYVGNRGMRLLGLIDINQPTPGAGWGSAAVAGSPAQMCVASAGDVTGGAPTPYDNCGPSSALETAAQPFNAKFPYLGYIQFLNNSGFSTYNALQVSLTQRTSHGLSFVLGYTYSRNLGTGFDNWSFIVPTNSYNAKGLYGPTLFDSTHQLSYSITYALPGKKSAGHLLDGWSLNSIVTIQSGQPWGVNDLTTDFSGTNEINNPSANGELWNFYGKPTDFKTTSAFQYTNAGQGGIPYFSGCTAGGVPGCTGSEASTNSACNSAAASIGPLASASLANLGCYAYKSSILIPAAYGSYGNMGINPFRGPAFYNWDFSITKDTKFFSERMDAQFRAEFFNILNHPNIANPYGGPGGSNAFTDPSGDAGASFGYQPFTPDVVSSNPVLGSGGPRAIQLGLKLIF